MELKTLNLWWDGPANIESDKHISELFRMKYIYKPHLLNYPFKKGDIYTIRGPRQVGKTTFLKLLIKEKLKSIEKDNIFYWSCDNLSSKDDLITLIKEYSDYCKIRQAQPEYILIDEITEIKDWQKAIKFIIDNSIVRGCCFILTGSNAIDLKYWTERLPGRRGEGEDIFFMPLTFRQYASLIEPEWYEAHKSDSKESLKFESDKLNVLLEKYLITGGIPLVINEFEMHREIPSYIYELYYSWIIGDIVKAGKSEQLLKEIIKNLLITYTTPINWNSLAKRSSVKSHVTIISYMELLSQLLVTFNCYFYEITKKAANYNKNKKIYFFDSFILDIFSKKLNISVEKGNVLEGLVASKIKHENITGEVYFSKFKKETDFVINDKKAIEVKYQNTISKEDFANKRYFKDFKIISKNTFDENIIPASIYLFMDSI